MATAYLHPTGLQLLHSRHRCRPTTLFFSTTLCQAHDDQGYSAPQLVRPHPHRSHTKPVVFVIMGVSASGKSTVAKMVSRRLNCPFYEGDDYHPLSNKAKMQSGNPLTDEDRWPWLQLLAGIIQGHVEANKQAVVSCSALKPSYRQLLRGDDTAVGDKVAFVLLEPSRATLEQRLIKRAKANAHFMPPSLLDSQLETLEYSENELFLHFRDEWPRRIPLAIKNKLDENCF